MQENRKEDTQMKTRRKTLRIVTRAILFGLAVFMVFALAVYASPAEPIDPIIYDVPLEDDLQVYIATLCEEHHIEPEVVIGLIEKESTFNASAEGDNGNSLGLMQIQPRWHRERMERLECDNLLDPYQNVKVGVDILAELIEDYGDLERALMVYNAGAAGAYNGWFQYGVFTNEYSSGVLENAANLTPREEVEEVNSIPDNYDIWSAHEEKQEQKLEQLPKCRLCEEPIQQETAVCIDYEFYCDDCLAMFRVEVDIE